MDGWRLSLKRDGDSFSLQVVRVRQIIGQPCSSAEKVCSKFFRSSHINSGGNLVDSGPFLDVVEQPELHLHAAAQAPLADLFIDTALQGRGEVIVETHSEPLLLRTQRRVAEGKLRPDQVALYFVEMTDTGSQLRAVQVYSGWRARLVARRGVRRRTSARSPPFDERKSNAWSCPKEDDEVRP
jgi:hypothetical protein